MMLPVTSFSSSSSSSFSASATVRVEKATSEFLIGPDWTMNIDICDSINSNHWLAKDVVKAIKKRLQHKNPKVQLLSLTLLETVVKNCGQHVHFQIAEKNILPEMIKIVKKKTDMHVREKILVLLDSWQEAFGGRGGKYPQYYFAYEELRHAGVEFPRRSSDTAPIFTPPVTHPNLRQTQAGYGMPSNSSTRLDEVMASEIENLSLSSIETIRNALDLLSDMLQAVNPNDRAAVKDEIIVDVVERCRSNQKKLMQMLATTSDEELLGQGLELNDSLQNVLAKHDAIASGSPLPSHLTSSISRSIDMHNSHPKPSETGEANSASGATPAAPVVALSRDQDEDEEEEEDEDDFAQLARRHSKTRSTSSLNSSNGTSEGVGTVDSCNNETVADPSLSMALALPDPPAAVKTSKEQDMIDFLSITLSTSTSSPRNPQSPIASTQNTDQTQSSTTTQRYSHPSQPYSANQGPVPFNSYVVPWAQPQPQAQPQYRQAQPQYQEPQSQPSHFASGYPPPPWAATPGYYSNQYPSSTTSYTYANPRNTLSLMPLQGGGPLQHTNSLPARRINGAAVSGDYAGLIPNPTGSAPAAVGQKPFIPSYRLFEDLNVLGNADGRLRASNASPSLGGTSGQSMVGGKK